MAAAELVEDGEAVTVVVIVVVAVPAGWGTVVVRALDPHAATTTADPSAIAIARSQPGTVTCRR
ncbi:MAG: hypothetical protein WAL63_01340 [Solirubrobacteraceae bacterium]